MGVSGPCYSCEYLKRNETWGGKVYCEAHKAYIVPDAKGCPDHKEKKN